MVARSVTKLEHLTDMHKLEIEDRYGRGQSILRVSGAMLIRQDIVSAHLRSKRMMRSPKENAKRNLFTQKTRNYG